MSLGNIFKGDKVIWMVFFFLCVVSVVEVFSASSFLTYKQGDYWSPVIKHGGILLLGMFFMIIILNIKCKYFKIVTPFMLLFSFILLVWVLFAGEVNGASRWVKLFGIIPLQPSEIAKGTMVLVTAQILSSTQNDDGADKHTFWWILTICAPMILLIAVENLSTAALISVTIFMMMCIGRIPWRQVGGLFSIGVCTVVLAVSFIMLVGDTEQKEAPKEVAQAQILVDGKEAKKEEEGIFKKILHRSSTWKGRILDFVNSEQVPVDSVDLVGRGAQTAYSKIAIASSRIVGVGPGHSEERDFLSQAFSDFIYAIIIEELGLLGAFGVAFLYIVLLFRVGRIAGRCENNFPAFLAMGLALMLVTQALFNMCVAVGLVPVTGQPLPLISKGGTSSVINCIYIGVILSVSRTAKKKTPQVKTVAGSASRE